MCGHSPPVSVHSRQEVFLRAGFVAPFEAFGVLFGAASAPHLLYLTFDIYIRHLTASGEDRGETVRSGLAAPPPRPNGGRKSL